MNFVQGMIETDVPSVVLHDIFVPYKALQCSNTQIKVGNCVGFLVEGVLQLLGSPIFEGGNEILLFDKALKFGMISQIYT